ncbi:MAG: hypothetical protein JWM82_3259 [Myxococcales bacterium]|nr:hypothetical protein [Myxococcales bacterium]
MPAPPLTSRAAAAIIEPKLAGFRGELTVADGAARGGLALRDAEVGLRWLASERGGELKATETGELLYAFPRGLVPPPRASGLARFVRATGHALASVGRFVVRAWVSVVLVTYAVVFVGVAIAMASSRDGDGVGDAIGGVLNVVFEALYWTFHPFSPVNWGREPRQIWSGRRRNKGLPFYERVNRFVFGPPPVVEDPRERERRVLEEIRRRDGRVGPGDLMRVTGADRAGAERDLLRLVVDYDGDIQVSDEGAIVYVFKALRTTAGRGGVTSARPAWAERKTVPPLTGNGAGTNLLLTALNGFNVVVSAVAVAGGLTVERVFQLVEHARLVAALGPDAPALAAAHGVPLLLGWVPLVFSTGLFMLPARRLLRRRRQRREIAADNGRRALMSLVVPEAGAVTELSPAAARRTWLAATGDKDSDAVTPRLEAAVRELGGEIDLDAAGVLVYRFSTEARERRALLALRAAAPGAEALPGAVVFSSGDPLAPSDPSDPIDPIDEDGARALIRLAGQRPKD